MEALVSPRRARFAPVAELWSRLLPEELSRHCQLADMSGGQLKVLVDSPSYMHELRLCSSELLGELQRRCPQARLKTIRFAIG
jgi:predicted nucleic acid-binding Zn ribbon protein